jgi:hypothetical protein
MNAIETLKAIKATISAAFAVEPVPAPAPEPTPAPEPEPQPEEMKEYALSDGTKVMIDKLEIGGKVVIVDPNSGAELVAADAEYNLADGSSISVAGGLITEVSAPEVPVEPDMAMEQMKAENAALKQELESLRTATNAGFAQIIGLFETLIQTPAVDPIEAPKTFAQVNGESKAQKFAEAAAALESFKQHKTK